eukprot:scaffold6230_cov127-Isochrysis_galbana.AAC.9
MNASNFLHIEARTELNKTSSLQPGPNWEYKVPALNAAGAPNAGQRDLRRLIAHFHEAWRALILMHAIDKRGAIHSTPIHSPLEGGRDKADIGWTHTPLASQALNPRLL